jgi:hypothetical protein
MKASPSKSLKTGWKKRSHGEAEGSAPESSPPSSPHLNPAKEWKKSNLKIENLLALVHSGFLREKEMDLWRTAAGDPYPMEKNPDEIFDVCQICGAWTSSSSQRLLEGSIQVLRHRVPES